MIKIALLSCKEFPDLIPTDQKLIPLFQKRQIEAEAVIWNDESIAWSDYHALIFRNTWDYYLMDESFSLWLDKIESFGIPTFNPIPIIRKNKHKFYLSEMAESGITIIPSIFIPKTGSLNLLSLLPSTWQQAVLKPAISAGSYLTRRFDVKDIENISEEYETIANEKDLILQKFIPEIQTDGEISLIFFNKIFSHAAKKTPKDGDFRIQSQFGGKYMSYQPSEDLLKTAQSIVNYINEDLLYARVDGILIDYVFHLMELELIEPDLYLDFAEDAQQKFVNDAVMAIHRDCPIY